MGPFLLSYEGFFSGNIYYKHCKFNLIFSDLVWLLKNPAKTKVFLRKFCVVNLETHNYQTRKCRGIAQTGRKILQFYYRSVSFAPTVQLVSFKRYRHSLCTWIQVTIYIAHSPCFLSPLADSLLLPFLTPLYLLGNPPSCDRIRPPWSRVACKLTSPFQTLSPIPPPSKFPEPQLPSASLRRPQDSGVFCPEHGSYSRMIIWREKKLFL